MRKAAAHCCLPGLDANSWQVTRQLPYVSTIERMSFGADLSAGFLAVIWLWAIPTPKHSKVIQASMNRLAGPDLARPPNRTWQVCAELRKGSIKYISDSFDCDT